MFSKILAVFIAFVMVFGGAAATAYAAQSSLPTDALYPVKTLGESVAIGLSVSSATRLEKALGQAQHRVDEMAKLAASGVAVPEQVGVDYSGRVEYSLRLAAKLPDNQLSKVLEKTQQSLQKQLSTVEQLRLARPDDAQLARVETRLREHLSLAALGLSNPQMFRERLAARLQGIQGPSSTQDPSATEPPASTETPEPGDDNNNNSNTNDSNSNDDNGNMNDDDANSNDDDVNSNDDDINENDDVNSNDDNINNNDDNNNDDDMNNDNDMNGNGDDSNGNGHDGGNSNGNGHDGSSGHGGNGLSQSSFLPAVALLGGYFLSE
jgi:hypothetical protein